MRLQISVNDALLVDVLQAWVIERGMRCAYARGVGEGALGDMRAWCGCATRGDGALCAVDVLEACAARYSRIRGERVRAGVRSGCG